MPNHEASSSHCRWWNASFTSAPQAASRCRLAARGSPVSARSAGSSSSESESAPPASGPTPLRRALSSSSEKSTSDRAAADPRELRGGKEWHAFTVLASTIKRIQPPFLWTKKMPTLLFILFLKVSKPHFCKAASSSNRAARERRRTGSQ